MIGTGNSGHDIAQDLYSSGADVTLVQRSPTLVTNHRAVGAARYAPTTRHAGRQRPDRDLDAAKARAQEPALTTRQSKELDQGCSTACAGRLQARLRRGQHRLAVQISHAAAAAIISMSAAPTSSPGGAIELRQFADIDTFVADGARMKSGETMPADLIVLATGYRPQEELVRKLFGDDGCGPRRPDLGFRRRPGAAQHVCAHRRSRTSSSSPAALAQCRIGSKLSRAADQGDRGRDNQITDRHCEERSDEAIHRTAKRKNGLLRFARNDGGVTGRHT